MNRIAAPILSDEIDAPRQIIRGNESAPDRRPLAPLNSRNLSGFDGPAVRGHDSVATMPRHLFWLVWLATSGCGGGIDPVAPSPPPPAVSAADPTIADLAPGMYRLTVSADHTASDFAPACGGPRVVFPDGMLAFLTLMLAKDGAEWVGRAVAPGADLELRFRDAGRSPLGRPKITGTLRGQAHDSGFTLLPRNMTFFAAGAEAGGSALVDAEVGFLYGSHIFGLARGDLRFRDAADRTSACTVVHISASETVIRSR